MIRNTPTLVPRTCSKITLISTPLTKAENPWPTFLVIFNPATLTSLIR